MEPLSDRELKDLLRRWEAPAAPASLRIPVGRPHQSLWRWLWVGRIHVPVPVGAGLLLAVVAFGIYSSRVVPPSISPGAGNAVARPAAPVVLPDPPSATPPAEHVAPVVTQKDKAETAALSGFQPVQQLEPKIVRVQP
jgi:hypothetical protein